MIIINNADQYFVFRNFSNTHIYLRNTLILDQSFSFYVKRFELAMRLSYIKIKCIYYYYLFLIKLGKCFYFTVQCYITV